MKSKNLIIILIALLFIFSSYSLIYVFININSLLDEINNYIKKFPYSPSIVIGTISPIYANIAYKTMSRVENIIYNISAELLTPNVSLPEVDIELLELKKSEIIEIISLNGIKSYFIKNTAESIKTFAIEVPFEPGVVYVQAFTPEFVTALKLPLKYGRYFTKDDPLNVVLINEKLCRTIFGDDNVIGKEVNILTDKGIEKYKIIGIIEDIPEIYESLSPIYLSIVIPYRKSELRKITNYKGEIIYAKPSYELYIIPEDGYEKILLKKIKEILGKEKFLYKVNSFSLLLENDLYFQVRKERISNISLVSILTILINLITVASFIIFDISIKRRTIGIKRAIGASIAIVANEYSLLMIKLLIFSFPFPVLLVALSLKLLNKFNTFGYFAYPILPTYVYNVNLDLNSIIISFTLLLIIILLVSNISVRISLKETPAYLIKSIKTEKRTKNQIIWLIIIITLSMIIIFTSLSSIINLRNTVIDLINDVSPDTYRIVPISSKSPPYKNFPIYTFEDYLVLHESLKDRAFVGFRQLLPEIVNLYNGKEKFTVRLSGATKDFPNIYNLTLKEGVFIDDFDFGKCVVGYYIYKKYNLKIGDLFLGREVVGILDKHSDLIDKTVYISIEDSSAQYATINYFGYFLIKPKNNENDVINEALNILKMRHPNKDSGEAYNIKKDIEAIVSSRQGSFITLSIFSIFGLFSSLLYLSITFLIEGIKRIKEIGIKRAIGADKGLIMKEFLLRGFKIGSISLCLGIVFGMIISFYISKKEGMRFYFSPTFFLLFILLYFFSLYLSLYAPAIYASSITPNEALKEE